MAKLNWYGEIIWRNKSVRTSFSRIRKTNIKNNVSLLVSEFFLHKNSLILQGQLI